MDLRVGAIVIAILDILAGLAGFGILVWYNIIGSLALIAAGICLLYGGIKYHQITTTVYLVFQIIGIVMYGILVIILLVEGAKSGGAEMLGVMVVFFLAACLQIYCGGRLLKHFEKHRLCNNACAIFFADFFCTPSV